MITNLRQNITGLEEILTAVNELPEAGSGGSGGDVKTCTVTFVDNTFTAAEIIHYIQFSSGFASCGDGYALTMGAVIENVMCNSIIILDDVYDLTVDSIDNTSFYDGRMYIYVGTSDTTVTFL